MVTRPRCAPFWPMISGGLRPAVSGELQDFVTRVLWPPIIHTPFVVSLVCPWNCVLRRCFGGKGETEVGSVVSERKEAKCG